mmetsp:Transcript_35843/g.84951  ORF Transcript_35843/g.84951 Transcript_35843/m.84951 type:complete len:233 (+) Transcript_35843:1321-2019(+)
MYCSPPPSVSCEPEEESVARDDAWQLAVSMLVLRGDWTCGDVGRDIASRRGHLSCESGSCCMLRCKKFGIAMKLSSISERTPGVSFAPCAGQLRGLEHSQGLRLLSLPRRPTPGRDKGTKHEAKTQHPQVPDLQGFPTATCCCRLFVSANVRQDLGPRSVSLQESRNRRKNASRAIATETKAQPRGSQRLCQLGRAWPLPHHLTTCAAAGSSEGHPCEPGCASLLERCPQVF